MSSSAGGRGSGSATLAAEPPLPAKAMWLVGGDRAGHLDRGVLPGPAPAVDRRRARHDRDAARPDHDGLRRRPPGDRHPGGSPAPTAATRSDRSVSPGAILGVGSVDHRDRDVRRRRDRGGGAARASRRRWPTRPGMTYFTAVAPRHRRGMSVAAFSAALLGGQALGPTFGGAIAGAYDWRVALGAAAVIGAAAGVLRARRAADPAPAPGGGDGRDRVGDGPPDVARRIRHDHRARLAATRRTATRHRVRRPRRRRGPRPGCSTRCRSPRCTRSGRCRRPSSRSSATPATG